MRWGHILTQLPGWFKVWPRVGNSAAYLRLFVLLILAVFFILAYVVCTSHGPINTSLPQARLDQQKAFKYGSFIAGHGLQKSDNLHNTSDTSEQQSGAGSDQPFRRTHGVVPVTCDPTVQLSEILSLAPIKFLPHYKNPCWHEPINTPIEDIYANNGFAKYSSTYQKAFDKLTDRWMKTNRNISYRLRCLPYFFLAGQPKCGSTDFYTKIVSHPDIVTPPIKESHWWGKNRYGWCLNYTATIPIKDYVDLYDGAAMHIDDVLDETLANYEEYHPVITGDASVSTLWSNDDWWKNPENCGRTEPRFTNADHVHLVLPQSRIIVILRNPTNRLYSDFLFFRQASKSQYYFHSEVAEAIDSLNECILSVGIRACVYNYTIASRSRVRLRLGLYQVYLQEWLARFPRSQVLVVRLEDYSHTPLKIVKQVHQFLSLRPLSKAEHKTLMDKPALNTRRESDKTLGVMLPETRLLLDNFYRPYNVHLAKLLGDERFLWQDD